LRKLGDKQETVVLYCKAQGILTGVPFFTKIFARLDCTVEWHFKEGTKLDGSKGRVEVRISNRLFVYEHMLIAYLR